MLPFILSSLQKMQSNYHESVMVSEVMKALHIEKACKYIDATLGTGGHTLEIANLGGTVLGIDMDPAMITIAAARIGDKAVLARGNFTDIDKIAPDHGFDKVSGILFDLGVSNIHLKSELRGFSFENPEAELDMRVDPDSQGVKASDLLNVLREDQMRAMFEVTLEPGAAKWLTDRVITFRAGGPIKTVSDMLGICKGLKTGKRVLNEATLPFLALRIAVNSELDNLKVALPKAYGLLTKGGRLVVISFHSGEDEIVKDFFREKQNQGDKLITFKPIAPGEDEKEANRRARSAKMRVLEKTND